MFAEMRLLATLLPEELDIYLANGWFRMRQSVFTTHFLCFDNQFYSAIWLRTRLDDLEKDTKWKELQKRNSRFSVQIKKAVITRQHEALYKQYKQGISFQASDNLHQLLLGYDTHNYFDTYQVNVYDDNTLIGAGFFDMGKISAAGIVSFYHPNYKKYSLGKYLIYQKMAFCRQHKLQHFYPGYVAPGYPLFDYKLTIGKNAVEYFNIGRHQWETYSGTALAQTPLQIMVYQLTLLQVQLKQLQIPCSVMYYRYFDAKLDPYFSDYRLFDYPVFLYYFHVMKRAGFRLIIYNVRTNQFELVECSSISQMEYVEASNHAIFSTDLLQAERVVFSGETAEEIALVIAMQRLKK